MAPFQKKSLVALAALFCFGCVNVPSSESLASSSALSSNTGSTSHSSSSAASSSSSANSSSSSSSSKSQSSGDLQGKFSLNATNSFAIQNGKGSFSDERGITYSLEGASSSSWFTLDKNGVFLNAPSSFYFTSITVDFAMTSPFGSLFSKASTYPITSPNNGAYALSSGQALTFGSGEAFAYFSLSVPVGSFEIHSIALTYDNALPHDTKSLSQLDFYSLNDTHGAAEEVTTSYQAGIEKLGAKLRAQEQANPDGSIVLSSGDMWQGSADSNMTKGLLMVDWMNGLGFESMAIGNHEFDWFASTIESNSTQANFPFLGINIRTSSGVQPSWAKSGKIVERSQVKIGVIGAIGPVEDSIAKSSLGGCYFDSNYPTLIQQEAARLKEKEGCALVVVSIHYGSLDTSLCQNVDAVFEGHTHQNYEMIDSYGIPHVQTYGNGSNIQHVSFTKKDGKFVFNAYESYSYAELSKLSKDPVTSNTYAYYLSLIVEKKNEVVGTISTTWSKATIASLSARLMYENYKNDAWSKDLKAAFVNGGCARQEIPAGDVTYGQIYAALPFDNDLILFSTSGSNLKSLLSDSYLSGYSAGLDVSTLSNDGVYQIMMLSYVSDKEQYASNLTEISRDSVTRSRDLVANYLRSQKNG